MHTYFHTTFGFCLWDLLALAILVAVVIMLTIHVYHHRQRQKELEKELAERKGSRSRTGPDQ